MPVPMSSETAPMETRAPCDLRAISAMRCLAATVRLAGSAELIAPNPARPDAPFVLGGPWISTPSPTRNCPSL
eukprot:2183006-Pyramimonas_sp.AAC.1